jgi:hypothetical protein
MKDSTSSHALVTDGQAPFIISMASRISAATLGRSSQVAIARFTASETT